MSSALLHRPLAVSTPATLHWHLRLHTHQHVPLFADWRCARAAAAILAMPRTWLGAQVLCWVLLPEMWCALLQAPDKATVLQTATAARQAASEAINRARGRGGIVWQPDVEASAVASHIDYRQFARSLIALPLRAGLAERIGAYPYWDAVWLSQDIHVAAREPAPQDATRLARMGGKRE
ncbi:hypothetical protein [Xanthomonas vesicatoria]|uniref:Uncharacterized protein n=1 Tax=Xanthomonas vesicatoria ATCC 35937 TaxID=925775 RepID=F0BHK1_9XANT|nr:hypothetical protein [Xanthomonas vesicatoria]APP75592.1 hypothetical protein BJD12_10410 [Xanthomonas vesicatoria ATCC 35937]EGD08041.1 hypothetical protein XVE_3738 [Xanthomonas vesicatoria ATCC 35937]KTF32635.1 hypothetical protein LMG920_12335 [Xanthomonas vesicatoria]MCC8598507.1 hypothetical protein [Xanthomonas vesicatoria]MCC8607093.1 hypothetical protein [Xanthomonas vesicatoria]